MATDVTNTKEAAGAAANTARENSEAENNQSGTVSQQNKQQSMSKPTEQQSVPVSKPTEQQSIPVSKPTEQQGVPVSKPNEQQDVPVSKPTEEQGVPVSKQTEELDVPVSKPTEEQGVPVSKPTEEQGVPVSKPIEEQDVPVSKPTEDQGLPVSKPTIVPVSKPTRQQTDNVVLKKERHLRYFLRLHLWAPFKFIDERFHFHVIQCSLLLVQIVKVVVITHQMVTFGRERANFTDIVSSGHIAIRHILLKNWEASNEVLDYPPSGGPYAVYHREELRAYVTHAVERFYNSPTEAVGLYLRLNESDMEVCIKSVAFEKINDDGNLDISVDCFLTSTSVNNDSTVSFDLEHNLQIHGMSKEFDNLLRMDINFMLHSVRTDEDRAHARCLKIEGTITFLEPNGNGQVTGDLVTNTIQIPCKDLGYNIPDSDVTENVSTVEAIAVLVFSSVSCATAFMAIVFGSVLTYAWYKKGLSSKNGILSYGTRLVRLWDIITIFGDVLTISGTVGIAFSQQVKWTITEFDAFTVWLGIGCLFAWVCLLRYFRFHSRFHLLFKALYKSMPNVFAYLLCVCVLFLGFVFCGFVVIGPYNVKFQTLSRTAECLFSMVNGDEIFYTLNALDDRKTGSSLIWWFTRFYVCIYVSVFTVVILNLLIAIFNTVYEEIQNNTKEKDEPPVTKALNKLMKKCPTSEKDIYNNVMLYVEKLNKEDPNISEQEKKFRQTFLKILTGRGTSENDPLTAFIEYNGDDEDVKTLCGCFDNSCSCSSCLWCHL